MRYIVFLAILIFAGCNSQDKLVKPAMAAAPVVQNAPPSSDLHKWSCVKGKDKREVEVVKKDNGCVLNYTQGGKLKEEATTTHDLKQCDGSEKKILAKLKKSGFQCS